MSPSGLHSAGFPAHSHAPVFSFQLSSFRFFFFPHAPPHSPVRSLTDTPAKTVRGWFPVALHQWMTQRPGALPPGARSPALQSKRIPSPAGDESRNPPKSLSPRPRLPKLLSAPKPWPPRMGRFLEDKKNDFSPSSLSAQRNQRELLDEHKKAQLRFFQIRLAS